MRFGLVEPSGQLPSVNAGWHMINAGIRYLFRQACPEAEFTSLPMLRPWREEDYQAARSCDALVLAGNPRYDLGKHEWLYAGVLDQMLAIDVPKIDAWAGGAVPTRNGVEHDARQLLANPRNQRILEKLKSFHAVIARDDLAQRVNELAGLPAVQMPCSSWWAAKEFGVEPGEKQGRVLIAQNVAMVAGIIGRHYRDGWRIVATSSTDRQYCRSIGICAELIYKPREILELFSQTEVVVSCRLHAAIPAASLGCKTSIIAIDTRAQAGDAFGIPWAPPSHEPIPWKATEPADPTQTLRKLIEAL